MFIADVFAIARFWKITKCPSTCEWTIKMWYMYVTKNYSNINKGKFMNLVCNCTKIEYTILSDLTHNQKD